MQAQLSKSQIFKGYNFSRNAVKAGKLDAARANRAMGILQAKNYLERLSKYQASIRSCNCPDHQHGNVCKHMIACMIIEKIARLENNLAITPAAGIVVLTSDRTAYWCGKQKWGGYESHLWQVGQFSMDDVLSEIAGGGFCAISKVTGKKFSEVVHAKPHVLPGEYYDLEGAKAAAYESGDMR